MSNITTDIFSILNKREKRKFYGLTVFNVVISLLDIFSLAVLLFIINFYTQQTPRFTASFLPAWLINRQSVKLVLLVLVFFLVKNVAAHAAHSLQYRFVYQVASRISGANMLNYLEGNFADHVHTDSAVFIRRISQQPIEFAHYILAGVQQIITETTLITLATATIMIYNAKLFLIVAVLLLPVTLLLWLYTRKKINATRSDIKARSADALQYLKEALAGYVESNIYDKNIFFTQRYAKSQQALNTSLANLQVIQGIPTRLLEVFAVFGLLILIILGNSGGENIAGFIMLGAFMAAAYKIIPGLVRIINLSGQIKTYRFTICDLLEEKKYLANQKTAVHCPNLHSLSFNRVNFCYNNRPVLCNFCMQIKPGDFVGIAGASGRGKTTIINILLGLLKEDTGEICINSNPQDAAGRKKFWQRIAYVKQQNFLIHDTIEKNIVLDEGDYKREKFWQAITAVGLQALIEQFPEGIKKVVTENGKNISGGQRQRIAIARALYRDVDLFILDEPFNELDDASELLLLQHFKTMAEEGKMIILITHEQKGLSFCNKIFSLND